MRRMCVVGDGGVYGESRKLYTLLPPPPAFLGIYVVTKTSSVLIVYINSIVSSLTPSTVTHLMRRRRGRARHGKSVRRRNNARSVTGAPRWIMQPLRDACAAFRAEDRSCSSVRFIAHYERDCRHTSSFSPSPFIKPYAVARPIQVSGRLRPLPRASRYAHLQGCSGITTTLTRYWRRGTGRTLCGATSSVRKAVPYPPQRHDVSISRVAVAQSSTSSRSTFFSCSQPARFCRKC